MKEPCPPPARGCPALRSAVPASAIVEAAGGRQPVRFNDVIAAAYWLIKRLAGRPLGQAAASRSAPRRPPPSGTVEPTGLAPGILLWAAVWATGGSPVLTNSVNHRAVGDESNPPKHTNPNEVQPNPCHSQVQSFLSDVVRPRPIPGSSSSFGRAAGANSTTAIAICSRTTSRTEPETSLDRTVRNDNCVAYQGKLLQIPPQRHRIHYVRAEVEVRE